MEFTSVINKAEIWGLAIGELSLKISSLDALGSEDSLEIPEAASFVNDKVTESELESVVVSALHSFHCH